MNPEQFTHLSQWLQWQESCHPTAIELGLDRVRQVAGRLGLLEPDAKVITVAGTNGKGSCVAAIETICRHRNLRTGVYTSPHVVAYNERIKIDGAAASDHAVCAAFSAINQARRDVSLTYFEFGTLAALYLFAQTKLDCWILEVGLGGRLDATNIIDATVAVITSIDIDHTEWLGDTREAIGWEKAGICRAGAPLVCADPTPPATVLDRASELGCPLYLLGRDFGCETVSDVDVVERAEGRRQKLCFWLNRGQLGSSDVRLPAPSIAAALQVADLMGWLEPVEDHADEQNALLHTLGQATLPGRMQIVQYDKKTFVLDVAHNPAAMAYLAEQLEARFSGRRYAVVLAMMADKNLSASTRALAPVVQSWSLATIPGLARAADVAQLVAALPTGVPQRKFATVPEAIEALVVGPDRDWILVAGSFYTVAEAHRYLSERVGGTHEATE